MTISVTVEDDAPLLTRVIANKFRCCLQRPGADSVVSGIDTRFSLKSTRNTHAVTIEVNKDGIHLTHGLSQDSEIIIHTDFDNPRAGQRVEGLWKHPWLAFKIGKLMSLPLPNWTDSAKRFWSMASDQPNVPGSMTITCTNEERNLSLGEGLPGVKILGPSSSLEQVFTGNALLIQEVSKGKLRFRGPMQHIAGLSGVCQRIMLGELHG